MNKAEFISQLAKKTKLSRKDAKNILDATIGLIQDQLSRGTKLTFTGFGTFEARQTKATTRFNPRTRQRISVPAKRVPKFRPGKSLKEALRRR
jgi:DNA-binding protein HU-beta